MPPFYVSPVAKGIKDRVEALVATSKCYTSTLHQRLSIWIGDKLYLGTNSGTLHIYDVARVEGRCTGLFNVIVVV
jgi:hypothetical protein